MIDLAMEDWDFEIHQLNAQNIVSFNELLSKNGESKVLNFEVHSFKLGDVEIQWAPSRVEFYEDQKIYAHNDLKVKVQYDLDFKQASFRRDFTLNAMGIEFNESSDPLLHDPWNGVSDLKNRNLVPVDIKHFVKDPLRLVRCYRFMLDYGFKISSELQAAMEKMNLNALSLFHLRQEFFKCETGLRLLEELDPWIKDSSFRPIDFPCHEPSYEKKYTHSEEVLQELILTETKIESWNLFLQVPESQFNDYLKLQKFLGIFIKRIDFYNDNFEVSVKNIHFQEIFSTLKPKVVTLLGEKWLEPLLQKYSLQKINSFNQFNIDLKGLNEDKRQLFKVWSWIKSISNQ
jgi:hypothetical protein